MDDLTKRRRLQMQMKINKRMRIVG